MLFEKTIQKIIDTKLDKTIKAYQKEIRELKAQLKEYQKKDPIRLDTDTLTALVRKANKNPDLKVEVKWSESGPWLKISTKPIEYVDVNTTSINVRPEEL